MLWRVDVKDIKRLGNVEVKDRNGSVKQRLWKDVLQERCVIESEVKERKGYLKQIGKSKERKGYKEQRLG